MVKDLVVQGMPRLGALVGASARGTALTRILSLKGSPGWLVSGQAVSTWQCEGITEQEGAVYLYGPHVSGISLASLLYRPLTEALPFLSRLVDALILLSAKGIPPFPLQTDGVLFSEQGAVLFLPPLLLREIRELSTFAVTSESYESLNHPDLKGEALSSFSIAVLLYRISSGRFPFTGESAEEMHERSRKLELVPPAFLVPELASEISRTVMQAMGRAGPGAVSLEQWRARLAEWQSGQLFRSLSAAEKEKLLHDAGTRREGSEKSFRRRVFWQRNWKTAAVITISAIVAGAVLGSIIANALKPRLTRGFPPAKVVETFYDSMNSLDHMAMAACVVGGAGRAEIDQVTTLYVTSRVTQGYEGKSNIISAAEWDGTGRPKLASPSLGSVLPPLNVTLNSASARGSTAHDAPRARARKSQAQSVRARARGHARPRRSRACASRRREQARRTTAAPAQPRRMGPVARACVRATCNGHVHVHALARHVRRHLERVQLQQFDIQRLARCDRGGTSARGLRRRRRRRRCTRRRRASRRACCVARAREPLLARDNGAAGGGRRRSRGVCDGRGGGRRRAGLDHLLDVRRERQCAGEHVAIDSHVGFLHQQRHVAQDHGLAVRVAQVAHGGQVDERPAGGAAGRGRGLQDDRRADAEQLRVDLNARDLWARAAHVRARTGDTHGHGHRHGHGHGHGHGHRHGHGHGHGHGHRHGHGHAHGHGHGRARARAQTHEHQRIREPANTTWFEARWRVSRNDNATQARP